MAWVPGAFGAFSGLGCPLLAPPPVRESFLLLPGPQGRSPNWQAACWPRHCPRGAPCCGSSRVEGSCVQGFPLAALTPPGKFFLPISSFPQILSKPPDSGILFSGPGPPMISQDHLPASNLCPYGKRLRHMWRPQPGPGGFRLRSSCWSSPGGTPRPGWSTGGPHQFPWKQERMVPLPAGPRAAITGSERRPAAPELRKWGGSRSLLSTRNQGHLVGEGK